MIGSSFAEYCLLRRRTSIAVLAQDLKRRLCTYITCASLEIVAESLQRRPGDSAFNVGNSGAQSVDSWFQHLQPAIGLIHHLASSRVSAAVGNTESGESQRTPHDREFGQGETEGLGKKKHKEPITTPFSAASEDSTRGVLRGCFHTPTTSQLPSPDTQSCCCQHEQHTLTHSHKCSVLFAYEHTPSQGRNTDREALRVNQRIVNSTAKRRKKRNEKTSHNLRSGLACLNVCNLTDQARRQKTKKFLFFSFLPVWLSGRLPAQNASARAGQIFFSTGYRK